jgi:signal transduction histidine kinase
VSGGGLSHLFDVGLRGDELATLGRTFDQMRLELARSRAALEQRLEEREELFRLKEEFLAGISHELRTPLNAIIGYTDMLAEERLTAEGRECLTTVRTQSEHLFRMVSDLLTLSGLNTGTLPVELSPVRVPSVVARLKPLADELCRGKDIKVEWICPDTLPTIETDPLRLEQILANLIANAIKFTPRGQVTLDVSEDADEERVVFAVSDTGIGIPAHDVPHIFDEFRQVDGSLTRVYGGVGLGLTLVKKLVALLVGSVSVRSQVGVGSTFTVALPLRVRLPTTTSVAA